MSQELISPTFLFRFSAPCFERATLGGRASCALENKYRLLTFSELDGSKPYADVRVAWNEQGIAITAQLSGKQQLPWCRESRLEDSDGMCVWIDTRATQNVHRASRYCHRFMFLPSGGGRALQRPVADQLLIHRARENANPIRPGMLQVDSKVRPDGYWMVAFIPVAAMTGYDPSEYSRLGFTYAIIDRELGIQTYTVGTEYPFESDPSLWGTLELVTK